MLQLAFRSFFFIAVLLGYSTGIWRLINDYFRHEFQSYLEQEAQTNKYLLRDPPDGAQAVPAGRPSPENGPPEAGAAHHRTVTDSISDFSNPIAGATDFPSSPVAAGKQQQEGEEERPARGRMAAEATDIRQRPREEEATGQGAEEDKWIAYWQHRKGKVGDGGAETNAFCSVGRNAPQTVVEGTEECGERASAEDL